tara:strand:+ start:34133 stop:34801 length:669 start_codon:yes stop_codon:yes gene_type:complete
MQEQYNNIYSNHTINVDDILKIDVTSIEPLLTQQFNTNNSTNSISNKESMLYNGYLVNSEGYINFPVIGKIMVIGKTLDECRTAIKSKIEDTGILINPTVDVKLLNAHFTVLGEVNRPGRYEYLKNNMNIFTALGIAGDLTINGKRKEIKIIRDQNGKKSISEIDITNTDFLKTNYQIFSGDVIIVKPNNNRVKNAGIIGNSGTLLSLLSFVLSSIIVISNN